MIPLFEIFAESSAFISPSVYRRAGINCSPTQASSVMPKGHLIKVIKAVPLAVSDCF